MSGGFGKAFDTTFLIFLAITAVTGGLCLWLRGTDAALGAVLSAARLLLWITPQFLAGLLIGGLLQGLISRAWMERAFGRSSGLRGLVLACVGGVITPTGPFAAFPLVFALWKAGADIGVLVTFLTGWALIGMHRVVVWEIPFMGVEFAVLRWLVCLPLPVLAGLIARAIARRTNLGARDAAAEA